jgi:hypothetical protein
MIALLIVVVSHLTVHDKPDIFEREFWIGRPLANGMMIWSNQSPGSGMQNLHTGGTSLKEITAGLHDDRGCSMWPNPASMPVCVFLI